jgi:hypothetical protein
MCDGVSRPCQRPKKNDWICVRPPLTKSVRVFAFINRSDVWLSLANFHTTPPERERWIKVYRYDNGD